MVVRDRLSELLGHRLVDFIALPWCLFKYRAAKMKEGLCVEHCLFVCRTHAVSSEELACELLLIEHNMEALLHSLGVRAGEQLGELHLPFVIAAHLSPDGCRFVALSPNENERGLRACICLARMPWSDMDRILSGFAHIVVPLSCACIADSVAHAHSPFIAGVWQAVMGCDQDRRRVSAQAPCCAVLISDLSVT